MAGIKKAPPFGGAQFPEVNDYADASTPYLF